MTEPPLEPPLGSFPGPDLPEPELDADEERLASLLAELADDPDAPPTTVTAASVLAAVHAQALAAETAGPVPAPDVSGRATGSGGAVSGGAVSGGAVSGGTVVDGRKRFQPRRPLVVGVLAAACLAAVAAVVIPLSLRSSETTTSAESALDTAANSAAAAGPAEEVPRQGAADQTAADQSAADQSAADQSAAGSAVAQAPEAAGGQDDAALPSAPTGAGGNAVCAWSPLSADAAAALTQSLPLGRFGAPGELIAACAAEPVAGARLPDTTGGSLVVTVVTAKPGACASGSSNLGATETGIRCVSQGSGRYLSTDAGGTQTAYAYAGGLGVAVGKDQTGLGLPEGDTVTADQLLAAAQAVLGALG